MCPPVRLTSPHLLPYSASKFALVGLSEGLRAELTRCGIYVTTVCPGLIRTGSAWNAKSKGSNEEEYAWFTTGDMTPVVSIDADGLTTIRNRHAKVRGKKIHFEFRGKSGVEHEIDLEDPRLAKIVRKCQDLPEEAAILGLLQQKLKRGMGAAA